MQRQIARRNLGRRGRAGLVAGVDGVLRAAEAALGWRDMRAGQARYNAEIQALQKSGDMSWYSGTKRKETWAPREHMSRTGGAYRRAQLSKVTVCAPKCAKKELKFIDFQQAGNIDSTGEIIEQLCIIPQGITESARVGRMAFIHSIAVSILLRVQASKLGSDGVWIRLALVQDRQANGAAAAYSAIYNSYVGPSDFPNLSNAKRFKILKTWNRQLNPTAGASGAGLFTNMRIDEVIQLAKKGNGLPIEYAADPAAPPDPGALSQIESNNIFLVGVAYSEDDEVQFFQNIRVRFTD